MEIGVSYSITSEQYHKFREKGNVPIFTDTYLQVYLLEQVWPGPSGYGEIKNVEYGISREESETKEATQARINCI